MLHSLFALAIAVAATTASPALLSPRYPPLTSDHASFTALHTALLGSVLLPFPFEQHNAADGGEVLWISRWLEGRRETSQLLVILMKRIDSIVGEGSQAVEKDSTFTHPPCPIDARSSLPLRPDEELILRAIYINGGGSNWTNTSARTTWMSPLTPPCQWQGVTCGTRCQTDTAEQRVEQLNLSEFGLTKLPESVSGLECLSFLDLGANNLHEVPDSIGQLQKLVKLYIANNPIVSLPSTIGKLKNLKRLILFSLQLSSIPDEIGNLSNLVHLSLWGNPLRTLPETIGQLTNLEELHLHNTKLQTLPETIGRLTKLKKLPLHDNELSSIPHSIGQLTNLTFLGLSYNKLEYIPGSIGQLSHLVTLEVRNNQLTDVPETIAELASLGELLIHYNKLTSIPVGIGQLKNLYRLRVDNNELTSIPESIGQLANLTDLYLYNNRLTSIPETIVQLRFLEKLYLYNNPLAGLPDLSRLTKLQYLYLSNTGTSVLPALPLSSLLRIDINSNNISGVINLCGPKLRTINMHNNPCLAGIIPSQSPCLPQLRSFNAAKCNITTLGFLRDMSYLEDLDISENAVGNQPFDLARSGSWPTLRSLRAFRVGAMMTLANVFASVSNITSLLSLDASGNNGIGDAIDGSTLQIAGVRHPIGLFLVRLDGTSVTRAQTSNMDYFPNVRILSLRNTTSFRPSNPVDTQDWDQLEQMDIRGTSSDVKIANPKPFPDTPLAIDLKTNSLCPTTLLGGVISQYSIAADPRTYNWSLCTCLENYYGEPWKGCMECADIPKGETGMSVDCHTHPGTMLVTGAWLTFNTSSNKVELLPCPSDSSQSPCQWASLNLTISNTTEWFKAIPHISGDCGKGFEDRLCSKCQQGFFRSGGNCYQCGGKGMSWLSPIASLVLLTALGAKSVSGGYRSRSGLIRTLTMHAQLVALLPEMSLRLSKWAGFFVKTSSSGSGGLRLNGLECIGVKWWDGFLGPFIQSASLPVVVVVGGAWISLISGFVGGGRAMPPRDRFKTAVFYLWVVLLFGSMQRLLAPLNCSGHGSVFGHKYIASALWIRCEGPAYRGLMVMGALLGIGYTIGTIALVAYRLRPSSQGTSAVSVFLRTPYTATSYYWEAVQLLRRVALAMTSSLSRLNSPLQPVLVSSILLISLLLHMWRKPYIRPIDNIVESVSLTLLLSSYVAGVVASNPRFANGATDLDLISWLFFAFNALFLFTLTLTVLFRSARSGFETIKRRAMSKEGDVVELDFWNINNKAEPLISKNI